MQILLTRQSGLPGTKKLLSRYGADLICVRYRYDAAMHERVKTIELIVERVPWRGHGRRTAATPSVPVSIRLREQETLLRRAILLAGGRWDEATNSWHVQQEVVTALGLESRILRRPRNSASLRRSTRRSSRRDPPVSRSDYR